MMDDLACKANMPRRKNKKNNNKSNNQSNPRLGFNRKANRFEFQLEKNSEASKTISLQ